MWSQNPNLRLEIENFSKKEAVISSLIFLGGGCEWEIFVFPKGTSSCDHDYLSLYLRVANRKSLRSGWKRSAKFHFVVNQHDKELYRSRITRECSLFCAESPAFGYSKTLPLRTCKEIGFLEKDTLIIDVYINVIEAFDGEDHVDVPKEDETLDTNGFQVFASQFTSVRKRFEEHLTKKEYMNVLSNACNKVNELVEVGFKMDWLKSKIDEVSLKRKKQDDDVSRVQQLEERVKNLEMMESGFKIDCLKSKLEKISLEKNNEFDLVQKFEERIKNIELIEPVGINKIIEWFKVRFEKISLERKKSIDANVSLVQELEERIKNLELMEPGAKIDYLEDSDVANRNLMREHEERIKNLEVMESGLKIDSLNSKLAEIYLERENSNVANESRIQNLEECIKELYLFFDSKLEERRQSDDANESLVQSHEERIKDLEVMISDLIVELETKKAKSFDDGFMLI